MSLANFEKYGKTILPRCVQGLNEKQLKAVQAPAHGRLQIIAGPGTGKTKVLISRVAYLIIAHDIPADNIIVTTFTKKAANEMVERLVKLFEGTDIDVHRLLIGTFHSICYRIIKKYGSRMGLEKFTIADERDKNHYIKTMLEEMDPQERAILENLPDGDYLKGSSSKNHGFDIPKIIKRISSLKARGIMPDTYANQKDSNKTLSFLYTIYQRTLIAAQKLDFDDCLLTCYNLITKHPVLGFVKHVLVDEFQDTNEVQLQLMYQFAKGHSNHGHTQNNVTIVGDPDQSIYAFRDAQSGNFQSMIEHYDKKGLDCSQVSLNENYRSTSDILKFSEKLMRQQKTRIVKDLNSQMKDSFKPVYKNLESAEEEARWICYQIEHLLNLPNKPVKYSDIAILFRSGYQTRVVETELVKRRIPYYMIRGRAFWERKEVQAILDYLRLCGDEYDRLPVLRTLNFPKRGIGAKTLIEIQKALNTKSLSLKTCSILKDLATGEDNSVKLSKKVKLSLLEYVEMIENVQVKLKHLDTTSESEINHLSSIFDYIYEKSNLKKEFSTDKDKQMNVEEVKSQLIEFKPTVETLMSYESDEESNANRLMKFIDSIGLVETISEELKNQQKEVKNGISLSTIHGSKGLEWSIVFVPGLSEGLLPAGFAIGNDDPDKGVDEERRCFYVATTRSKLLLYISSYTQKSSSDYFSFRRPITTVSRFLIGFENIFTDHQLLFSKMEHLKIFYKMLQTEMDETFKLDQFFKQYVNFWKKYRFDERINFNFKEDGIISAGSLMNGFSTAKRRLDHGIDSVAKKSVNRAPPYIPDRRKKNII